MNSTLVPLVVVTGVPRVHPDAAGVEEAHVVPLLVSTLPELLGATNVGADAPLPKMTLFAVRVARLVPPLATGRVPVTPVVSGKLVAFVNVPLAGMPRTGAVRTGEVSVLFVSVCVPVSVTTVPPLPPTCANTSQVAVPEVLYTN